ncbi:MAG: gliding motility protein GldC [Ignavibacteria bacterium]|nr:gliding motility protein GldC [Ignavibacteria bacterium]MBT8382703.1 gliding motility protein GldC [Ignavibacteria bacterium]MBT8392769.1 gliding motility protein GldC [Ignavibacteria bacterium]NNJ54330.1 gliding motility protein GldC [Ignavibacteriaceae bacterium]NNL22036.1 gliding motility protein GldC [Ignavibacteriaceae bacterium]
MSKNSQIKLFIALDEKKMPEKIEWEADDAQFSGRKESKTMILSLWDKKEDVTFSIDLWTKEMTVNEMQIHFYQIFVKMAESFQNATNNFETASLIREFADSFAKKTGIGS